MVEIVWTKKAFSQFEKAIHYIKSDSVFYAQRVHNQTYKKLEVLHSYPLVGPIEPFLSHKKLEYRYLIVWSYKIIYRFNKEKNTIFIVRFFHTSRNPSKLLH